LSNTAMVLPPAGITDLTPNIADDIDTLTPQSDLRVTKTNNSATATPGGIVIYTITVTNAGPSSVNSATVVDAFGSNFTNVTFTSAATGGAAGNTASGTGTIQDTVSLPVGATITYIAQA